MKSYTKVILISVGGLFTSLVLAIFVVTPMLNDLRQANFAMQQKKQELATLEQQIREFKTAQSYLAKATRKEDIADAIVPKESLVIAVEELEAAAEKTNTKEFLKIFEITERKPNIVTGHKGIDEVAYHLAVSNDFLGILNFLSYVEHLPHFTEINKIDLTPGGASIDGIFFIKSEAE